MRSVVMCILFASVMLAGGMDRSLAEKTAKLMVEQMKAEEIIRELPRKGLIQQFEIPKEVCAELREWRERQD